MSQTRPAGTSVLLVVDNDLLSRTVRATELRREGFEVFEASDAHEALAVLRCTEVDILLPDINLDEGAMLADWVEKRQPSTYVAWTLGLSDEQTTTLLH